ncbi:glycosyltransferase [Hanstruepera marina]|uniref:glycosyltransferase n=1 Tax=Hanstruepera marina TaxID=2873265 RepID=UPI001CA62EBC|nr:glycosyltransferase [Hanstruepera marina]
MQLKYSFIIPVYNRPDEVDELLLSFKNLTTNIPFEIVIVEDGSNLSSEAVVNTYKKDLDIQYLYKDNSGPGDSRNYGMKAAKGNYYIVLDSDCILPSNYLYKVQESLLENYVDCFGGPDAAHSSFSNIQKAINFSMTSVLTTGGIRGNKASIDKFQPRSFNMGISKEAFLKTGGFGRIHPGEDPDLSIRLWKNGFQTKLINEAFVYHKRRISWSKFYIQVKKFGLVRPILNTWHPETRKVTYWFPTIFVLGFLISILLLFFKINWPIFLYAFYFFVLFISALFSSKSLTVSILALLAVCIQFWGYGLGFLKSIFVIKVLNKNPEEQFPDLFFKAK